MISESKGKIVALANPTRQELTIIGSDKELRLGLSDEHIISLFPHSWK